MEKMKTMKTTENWYDDINPESVGKATEVKPRIDLPQPGQEPIIVAINEEPRIVKDSSERDMFVGEVFQLSPNRIEGSMIYPKSLRFNIAKAIARTDKNFKKVPLSGKTFKIWSVEDDGKKYYQCELWTAPTFGNQEASK